MLDHLIARALEQTASPSRRTVLGVLAGLTLGGVLHEAEGRKVRGEHNERQGGKKTIMCVNGQTVRKPTRKRKKFLKQGATRGECPPVCTPVCKSGACGVGDGCGGTCSCVAGQVCAAGTCQACNVSCNGRAPVVCGAELAAKIVPGGNVYICPGTFEGLFALPALPTNLYGSGSGSDPAVDTILDGASGGTVIVVSGTDPVTLSGLAVINGSGSRDEGGALSNQYGAPLTVDDCTFSGNTGAGAGAIVSTGGIAMTNSRVLNNIGIGPGAGGIALFVNSGSTSSTFTSSEFAGNSATSEGGAIQAYGHTMDFKDVELRGNSAASGGAVYLRPANAESVTFDSACQIVSNTGTSGGSAIGGIDNQGSGSVALGGATVSGNMPVSCANVPGC